jgi:hypothetical protein
MAEFEQHRREFERDVESQFIRAVRFEIEEDARKAYFEVQNLIFDNDCDLSVYRFKLNQVSHVAALGAPPEPNVLETLDSVLSRGAATELPRDIARMLTDRRREAQRLGPWVEGHYRPARIVPPESR